MGSSCFSRGNKKAVEIIKKYLGSNQLSGKVLFKGGHCFGECEKGPILIINDKVYHNVNHENIEELLNENLAHAIDRDRSEEM